MKAVESFEKEEKTEKEYQDKKEMIK